MPGPVRVVVLDDARFLLDYFCPGARARHRRAQEDVDDEHDEEEDAQSDGEPKQPRGMDATFFAELGYKRGLTWVEDEDARGCHEDAFVGVQGFQGGGF